MAILSNVCSTCSVYYLMGKSAWKQYMGGQTTPLGIQTLGLHWGFRHLGWLWMYQGSPNGKRRLQKGLGLGGDIVIRMAQGLVKGKTYKVFADNFFTSLPFVNAPKDKSIHFRGHISCKSLQGVSPEDGKRAEAAWTSQTSIRHIILSAIKTRSEVVALYIQLLCQLVHRAGLPHLGAVTTQPCAQEDLRPPVVPCWHHQTAPCMIHQQKACDGPQQSSARSPYCHCHHQPSQTREDWGQAKSVSPVLAAWPQDNKRVGSRDIIQVRLLWCVTTETTISGHITTTSAHRSSSSVNSVNMIVSCSL